MRPELKLVEKSKWKPAKHDLTIYVPTGIYYVRKSFRRLKIPSLFRTTGEKTIGRARAKAQDLIQAHIDFYIHGKKSLGDSRYGSGKTVSAVIKEFLKNVTPKNRREGTQENHLTYFTELDSEWGKILIDRINDTNWNAWLDKFKGRKERTTFNDYAVYMNMLIRYAYNQKYITHVIKLPFDDEIKESGRVYTEKELTALSAAMNDECRDQFILSYYCAMRLREVLYLTWDRVDLKTGLITLGKDDVKTGSKTGKGRSFICGELALIRLRKRFENRVKGAVYVFPSPTDPKRPIEDNKTAWRAAKRRAGINGKARWHDLRHTAITNMLMVHKQLPIYVSRYAGVSLRTIERVYLHSKAEQTRSVGQVLRISDAR